MHPQTVIHPTTNPTVHGRESNLQPVDHKSDTLTTVVVHHISQNETSTLWMYVSE